MGCFSSRVEAPTEELPGPPAVELDAPTPADTAAPTQPAAALPSTTDLGVSEEQWREMERWRELEKLLEVPSAPLGEPSMSHGALAEFAANPIVDYIDPKGKDTWSEKGGTVLEKALTFDKELGGSPVRLVDARFLVALAADGGIMPRRQDLPESAFVDLERLRNMGRGNNYGSTLRVVCVSHPWLQPDHPDPIGTTLRLIARALNILVRDTYLPATYFYSSADCTGTPSVLAIGHGECVGDERGYFYTISCAAGASNLSWFSNADCSGDADGTLGSNEVWRRWRVRADSQSYGASGANAEAEEAGASKAQRLRRCCAALKSARESRVHNRIVARVCGSVHRVFSIFLSWHVSQGRVTRAWIACHS